MKTKTNQLNMNNQRSLIESFLSLKTWGFDFWVIGLSLKQRARELVARPKTHLGEELLLVVVPLPHVVTSPSSGRLRFSGATTAFLNAFSNLASSDALLGQLPFNTFQMENLRSVRSFVPIIRHTLEIERASW